MAEKQASRPWLSTARRRLDRLRHRPLCSVTQEHAQREDLARGCGDQVRQQQDIDMNAGLRGVAVRRVSRVEAERQDWTVSSIAGGARR
jgi:hypothetical protein